MKTQLQNILKLKIMKKFAQDQISKIRGLPNMATQRVETILLVLRTFMYQSVVISLTSGVLLFMAMFIYGSFYFAFVPSPIHHGPVHLIFEPCHEKMGKCGFLNSSVSLSERNPVLMTGTVIRFFFTCAQVQSCNYLINCNDAI